MPVARHVGGCLLGAVLALGAWSARGDETLAAGEPAGLAPAEVVLAIVRYTRWPAEPRPLLLCLAGDGGLAEALRRLLPEAADPRGLALRELPADTGEPPADCAAWIHDSERPAARLVTLHALAGRPVLTIGWTHAFCRDGGMFCLEQGAGRTRFEVNLDAVERGRLRVHPQVLRLARARSRG
ncbi:YfiR family protein [Piscinibacter sakaiensis]|uniref:Uncharacterized protein YfiR n=1 Tax=Piscinibacter sakaiensis TaxID=1547922 RepID=A0A0K8P056_PISS1|nr:YfiR family protein [Piscinibacter sakaiensis]GAP35919.1 uncharacterized protein YfiR precursor [Piscinibacter sakaiensis]